MDDLTRRAALQLAAVGTAAALTGAAAADDKAKPGASDDKAQPPMSDRERVLTCGLTEAEADCWELSAQAAGKFFELPKLHPMDDHEVAHAIHVIQHKLLSRPTYRKYLDLAKGKK